MCFRIPQNSFKIKSTKRIFSKQANVIYFTISNACHHAYLLMYPVHQEKNYSLWQQVAYSLAVGRQSNDAKSGLRTVLPRIERDIWLKISAGLYNITQSLLTLFYCKFMFTNKGSSPGTPLSIKWAGPSTGASSYGTEQQVLGETEGRGQSKTTPSVTAQCSSEVGQARRM